MLAWEYDHSPGQIAHFQLCPPEGHWESNLLSWTFCYCRPYTIAHDCSFCSYPACLKKHFRQMKQVRYVAYTAMNMEINKLLAQYGFVLCPHFVLSV